MEKEQLELELINRAKNGDKISMNLLISDNYTILKGYIIKMTGNLHLSEDIIQETLLNAIININKFTPKVKFSTWLIKIATNKYRDFLKKKSNVEYVDDIAMDLTLGENPEQLIVLKGEVENIFKILQALSYEKRAVFILKHYYGYSYEEISKILNCPIGTVRSRLHYCIKYILSKMKGDEYDEWKRLRKHY